MEHLGQPDRQTRARRVLGTVLAAAALLAVVCGCSGESGDEPGAAPSTKLTEIAVDCPRYEDTARRITDAQTAIYDGKASPGDEAAVDALVAELDALKEDAPADVSTALTDLGEGFRSARELLEHPTPDNRASLTEIAPALAKDSQVVTAWIVDQCGR